MIIKKLRKQRNWSQDQLSKTSGLSLRTIQRIEGGNKASMESLKALSAVFETNVENLEQEVIVVDKESEQWKKAPLWIRVIFFGSNTIKFKRKDAVIFEMFLLVLGVSFIVPSFLYLEGYRADVFAKCGIGAILSAYYMSVKVRIGDRYRCPTSASFRAWPMAIFCASLHSRSGTVYLGVKRQRLFTQYLS